MSRKRPTEASWDSDDDDDDNLLNEDTLSFITTHSKDKYEDDELDEEALLAPDEDVEKISKTKTGKITVSTDSSGKITLSTNKFTAKSNKTVINVDQNGKGKNRYSPVKWDVKEELKTQEFELEEEPEEIELLAPDEDTDFDSYSGLDSSQTDAGENQPTNEDEPAVEVSVFEENDDAETTHEHSRLEVDTTRDESDESEDEEEKRGGRFKSERQDIITISTKKPTVAEIPATLEISAEQQAELNQFMAQKDKRRKPNQRVPFQQQQNRIQTITSTHIHTQELFQPPSLMQQTPVFQVPHTEYSASVPSPPKQKMYVNPKFFEGGKVPHVARHSQPQPLMYNGPPRSQPLVYHQEKPPQRHFQDHPRPLMDPYRPTYNPPVSQQQIPPHRPHPHFQGPHRNNPPRFQHPMEQRPLYGGPPPQHMIQENYRLPHQSQPHNHPSFHQPPHSQPSVPARPRFPFEGPNGPGPRHYTPQLGSEAPRPNQFHHQQHRMQQPPQLQHQPRNNFLQPRQQNLAGHTFRQMQPRQQNLLGQRPRHMQPSNRFQSPRPSIQQQQSKKLLQKAREARVAKFNNIQTIPVIGRQAVKRPSTEDEGPSPPKISKTEPRVKLEESDDYLKKMEQQKALRERIRKQKEMKRLVDASKRRQELRDKLAKEGKTLSEIEDSGMSTDSGNEKASPVSVAGQIPGNVGRGQTFGQRGQLNRGQGQRGQPANRAFHQVGRGQFQVGNPATQGQSQSMRGHPANRGQGQYGIQHSQGQYGIQHSQGQRGHPANRGQFQQHQVISNQGHQGQQSLRGQNLQRGRGQRGKLRPGLKPGQTMEIEGSGPVNVLRTFNVTQCHVNDQNNQPREVRAPGMMEEVGEVTGQQNLSKTAGINQRQPLVGKQQIYLPAGAQPVKQVTAPRIRRMKKIIRIKKNAQGQELSREEEMVPMDDDESLINQSTPATGEQAQRTVVNSKREILISSPPKSTRTVIASGDGNGRRNIVQEDTRERAVMIDNLSLSTSDYSIKSLCTCIGPIESFQRMGKSAIVKFVDPRNAITFTRKYNRHMLDLSHIMATLIKE